MNLSFQPCPAIVSEARGAVICTLPFGHPPTGPDLHKYEETTREAVAARWLQSVASATTAPPTKKRHACKTCGAVRSLGERHATDCAYWNARLADPKRVGLWETRTAQMSDEWSTPGDLFDRCNAAFGPFTIDAASSPANHLCPEFLTKRHDAPSLNVGAHRCWMNPPYSRGNLARFMRWALVQTVRSAPVFCCLVPAYTAEGWWIANVASPTEPFESPQLKLPAVNLGVRLGIEEDTHEGMLFIWRRWRRLSIGVHFIPGRVHFTEADGSTGPARYSSAVVVYQRCV